MGFSVNEKDWKLFRKCLPGWQERYMETLIREYQKILDDNKKASEKFWNLEGRIKQDKKSCGVICEMSRSKMHGNIAALLDEGAITIEDLEGFSDEIRDWAEARKGWKE